MGITRCFWWKHLRRHFADALLKDVNSSQATISARAVCYINRLFELEKNLEVLLPEGKKNSG